MDTSRTLRSLCMLCAVALLGGLIAACSGPAAGSDQLTICEDSEVTGASASISMPNDYGAQAKVDQLNSTGGILGHKLNLVLLDNQSQPALAAQIAQECIQQYHAWAIIGMSSNVDLIPAIPVVNKAKVPTISWSAGWNYANSGLTPADYAGYAFPGRATSAFSTFLFLQNVVVPQGLTRVAMIEANSAGALDAANQVQHYLDQFHLTLTDTEQIQPNQTNVTPVVLKLLESKPQAIIMNTIAGTASVTFLQALRAQDSEIPTGVCAGCTTTSFVNSVGGPSGMHNVYCLGKPADLLKVLPDDETNAATFSDINDYYTWVAKSGQDSTIQDQGMEGWNTVEMLAHAATTANSIKADDIKNALQNANDDTGGQLWARTPTDYDNVNQQNAIVTINADGSFGYVKNAALDR